MELFGQQMCIDVSRNEPEAVWLAAKDLQRDLIRLSGGRFAFPMKEGTGIRICTIPSSVREQYTVSVGEKDVTITGSDTLGTVYGIYAFSTKCLRVLPVHRLTDLFPEKRESLPLEEGSFSSEHRPVRYRGWFLNDEDLLCELKLSGGKRNIDYPFYAHVMDVSVLDMILETALRLEMNLIIPGSFVDICNPDEEVLVKAVCRRGMYISQHHVEPVGVSYCAAENYLKGKGLEEPVSFISNRSRMEEIWQHFISRWAAYGSQVVWQLGLRGKGDSAVWNHDPTAPRSMEERGGIITDAIRTQYEMIRTALGHDRFDSTATLWNEGSQLYGSGKLSLPERTIAIFADFGISQMFGEDFYSTPRLSGRKYGVYYHTAFWAMGPHMTEGCAPQKMAWCYRDAAALDSLEYSILNVTNVRPVHFAVSVNAQILRSPATADAAAAMESFDRAVFGACGGQISALRQEYYLAFADFGREALMQAAEKWHFYYRSHENAPFTENAATDGQLAWIGKGILRGRPVTGMPKVTPELLSELRRSEARFSVLYEKLTAVEGMLPENTRDYFRCFLQYQALHMLQLTRWLLSLLEGRSACGYLEVLLEARKVLEQGHWQHWHRGDHKIDLPLLQEMTQRRDLCEN